MMKFAISAIALLASLILMPSLTSAAGGCPQSAENLQAFAGCLAPVRGTISMVYKGTAANLDQDHQALLAAMQRNPGVPPQVMPTYTVAQPYGGYYNPFNSAMWQATMFVAASRGMYSGGYWAGAHW